METHEAFLQLCLKSLNQKECDQYIVEMIEAGIDISYLFNTSSTPTLSEVKTAYEKYIKESLMLSISSGMNLSDISNIFLQDLTLKVRLQKLSDSLNKEKQISYNSCEIDEEKSIAKCTDKEKQSSDKLKPDSECESSSLKSNVSNSQVSSDICEMKDSNKVDSEQITFWICPSCTSHNPRDLLHCQICDLIKDFERAHVNGVAYFILSLPVSQYSLGAVSACTNMSFQALSECLHNLSGSTVPFGCTVDVLKNILTKGSKYVNTGHQDLEDVISSRPDVMDKLYQFPGMIDINPRSPFEGLKKGELFLSQIKNSVGCIITCQAQSIAVIYVYPTNKFILFDSHSRQHNKRSYGACLLFFDCLVDISSYLQHLFPPIDQPDISIQSHEEQAQYANLSVAQGDFFCLKSHAPISVNQCKEMPHTPINYLPLPPPSPSPSNSSIHMQEDEVVKHRGFRLLEEENIYLREKLRQTESKMFEIKNDIENQLCCERLQHRELHQEFILLKERIDHKLSMQTEIIEYLRNELALIRYQQGRIQSDVKNFPELNERTEKIAASNTSNLLRQDVDEREVIRLRELDRISQSDFELARQSYFNCCICRDDVHIEDKFDLEHLDHCICRECAKSYLEDRITSRHFPIKCLFENCDFILSDTKCFEVLPEEHQQLYLELSSRPNSDPHFRQCPVPNCTGFDIVDVDSNDCVCAKCDHHWCCQCQVDLETSQHQGISCQQYQQWKKDNDHGDEAMERFLRNGLSDKDGADRMRRCPNCRTAYMKDRACNHVVCTACKVHFCFRCAKFSGPTAEAVYLHQSSCADYTGP